MKVIECLRHALALLACQGMLLSPGVVLGAAPSHNVITKTVHQSPSIIRDVSLNRDRQFSGLLLDHNGQSMTGQDVLLASRAGESQRTSTDDQGLFCFTVLRGGIYRLYATNSSQVLRLWTHGTAPPNSRSQAVLVSGGQVMRGQRPISELFISDPLVLGVILAAAIAIPIAVHNSRSAS